TAPWPANALAGNGKPSCETRPADTTRWPTSGTSRKEAQMTATATIAGIPQTFFDPHRRWLRWRSRIVLATVAIVLATAAAYGVNLIAPACGGLRSGIPSIGGECVGITDGGYVFSPELKTIEDKIKKENDWVRQQPPPASYVNVVLLSPFPATASSPMTIALI